MRKTEKGTERATDKATEKATLRAEAEILLKQRAARQHPRLPAEERRLLQELEVHQIELELQNEELRAARLEAEAGLERYTLLFDFAPVGYAMLDPDGTIRAINHVGASLLGQTRARSVGTPFESFLAPRDRSTFSLMLLKALDRETQETCEVALTKRGQIPLAAQLKMQALTRGEPTVLLTFEDITERRQREQLRARAEETLREMDRRKDEFLAELSHELRNPLAPIRNSLFLLAHAAPNDEMADKARAIIDRQVGLLTHLVDDLLDVTRIASGKIRLLRDVIEIEPLVRQTLDDQRPTFEKSGIHLEARIMPGPFWVDADGARLVQALSNLLGNAEKYTPRGGTVRVTLERLDGYDVALRVRDTGVGIALDMLPYVFESFVQAPQTLDRAGGGVGLGLSMVKGLIELHGGTVSVDSDGPGLGTEVTIRLPLTEAPKRSKAKPPRAGAIRARRVLVIDDNEDNVDSMRYALGMSGHDVRVARDGAAGVELARRFHPEVVVSDIALPGMNGYEVARALRADETLEGVCLIALSGYTRPEDLERSANAGFDRHLGKPVAFEDLDRLISRLPGLKRSNRPTQLH